LDIAVGPGVVWVSNGDGTLSRIDPTRGEVSAPIHVDARLASIAVDPVTGDLWGVVSSTPPEAN